MKICFCVLAMLFALFASKHAHAQEPVELRYDLALDASVAGGGTALWVLSETFGKNLFAQESCAWCEPPGIDASARSLRWNNTEAAQVIGTITSAVGAPVTAFGLTWLAAAHDDRGDEELVNAMLIVEAVAITMLLNNIVKWAVGRERPAVHYREGNWESFHEDERNLSFFSAHSSFAFSFAVASGTIASMREYRLAPLVWAVGLPLATFTAYSRIAGDAHYFTDVLVGSVVGSVIGFAIPFFFHGPTRDIAPRGFTVMPVITANTIGVSGTF